MGVKGVCSGCASWIEEGWSYCMHCGTARPVRRSSLNLSTSLYSNNSRTTAVGSKDKRSLRRRRQSSEEVDRQLQQWRRKSKIQEGLLQELERRNVTTQRAVVAKTESDLRRVVHGGRALIRKWPSSSASSSMPPMTGKSPSEPASTKIDSITNDSNREGSGSAGNDVDYRSRSPTGAQPVYAAVTREEDGLHSPRQPSAQSRVGSVGSQAQQVEENVQTNTPQEERALPRRVGKSAHESSINIGGLVTQGQQQPSGWFWGAGGCGPGDGRDGGGCDVDVVAPGEGTMAAYWRGPSAPAGKPAGGTDVARYAANSSADSTIQQNCSSSRQASFGETAATENPSYGDDEGPLAGKISNSHNSRLFVSVASAKAAVRSASNRAAELSHLLREGNDPPREECLAKAESAVRAAESAISCANERLFQLELMAAAEPTAQEVDGGIDGAHDASAANEKQPSSCGASSSLRSSSSLSAHIEELTEQLALAQGLQAVSVAARARLSRGFELEAIAAVRLQSLVRGSVSRWRERRKMATLANKEKTSIAHVASAFPPLDSSLSRRTDVTQEGVGKTRLEQRDTHIGTMPRTEELWWTPAEAESADAIGESESVLLRAVVKLQATVRSLLARSRTIAAVNARFVEHFDEEHQHPFYVCSETNTSQWNAPFGFASGGGVGGGFSSPLVRGVDTTELLEGKASSRRACSSLAESTAEEIEEMRPVFLRAVVKLQAIVRSWIARSRTFAAVNARFVEHFDEVHQHPFYVCTETNSSQWNQPFGFGCTRGQARRGTEGVEADDTPAATTANGGDAALDDGEVSAENDCGGTTNSEDAGQQTLCGASDGREAAVTVIQCAMRAARARARLAEKIVLASL